MKVLANTDADIRITVLCKSLEPCLNTLILIEACIHTWKYKKKTEFVSL